MSVDYSSIDVCSSTGIPVVKLNEVLFHRKENEDYWTYSSLTPGRTAYNFINDTAKEMTEYLAEGHSTKDLYDNLTSQFPDVPPERIQGDINNLVAIMWQDNYISWKKEDHPYMSALQIQIDESCFVAPCFDDSITDLVDFIKNAEAANTDGFISNEMVDGELSLYNLRRVLFEMSSIVLCIYKDGELCGFAIYRVDDRSSNCYLDYCLFAPSVDDKTVAVFFGHCHTLINLVAYKKVDKVKVYVASSQVNRVTQVLKPMLSKICCLKKEYKSQDHILYECFI